MAKIVEAHWDAVAILAEAGRAPEEGAIYAVWASEVPNQPLAFGNGVLTGTKAFCSGRSIATRALVTVGGEDGRLLDIDLRSRSLNMEQQSWCTTAFGLTDTGPVVFDTVAVAEDAVVGERNFYLDRPGFWHGACGPAACWAGGVAGLLRYAERSSRKDPHTLAHLGALRANDWALRAVLERAGNEIDGAPGDRAAAHARALKVRHIVEVLATDMLRRFARTYGPYPLAMDADVSRRYQEVDLFLRQAHGERDLQVLGELR